MTSSTDLLGEFASYFNFASLTKVQERVLPSILTTEDNIVVAAPTGSGKTLLLEVAILHLFRETLHRKDVVPVSSPSPVTSSDKYKYKKAVYICPIKALANEKYEHWTSLFPSLVVVIETGDHENTRSDSLDAVCGADIIITTPERWDSITRRWREKHVFDIVNSVVLVLLDEIHTVHEERGAALEAIVSRMKAIKAITDVKYQATRFVAISGTLPNVHDFATWLGVQNEMVFSFSPEDRPVPLTIRILSYPNDSNNAFAFDRFLSFKIFHLVKEHAEGKPSIIFCSTRNQAVSTAQQLVQNIRETAERQGCLHHLEPSETVQGLAEKINDRYLRSCALVGIAFHHAALSLNDRRIVEDMFRRHYIVVVCTTTTLSLGVNLPAHLVIVKGTTFYNRGTLVDIPVSEVAQMCGRAGRPGLDSHGVALILTTTSKQKLYMGLSSGDAALTVVESQLHCHIIEHVNAEIALRTINNFPTALDWVKTTFFWLRLNANPEHYGLTFANQEDRQAFNSEMYAELLIEKVLDALEEAKCISRAGENNTMIESTAIGRSMSRLYISFGTVVRCNEVYKEKEGMNSNSRFSTKNFSIPDVLQLLSQCDEFSDVRLRQGDRGTLNSLNKEIRFPLSNGFKGGREIRENWHKINVLIQAHMAGHHFTDMSLRNDIFRLLPSVHRTVRFIQDYAAVSQSFSFILAAEQLQRSLEKKVWPGGPILKQLVGITEEMGAQLNRGGICSFADIIGIDPHKIEAICSKNPPFGQLVHDQIARIPTVDITVNDPVTTNGEYKLEIDFLFPSVAHNSEYVHQRKGSMSGNTPLMYVLLVGDESDRLLLSRKITLTGSKLVEHYDYYFLKPNSNTSLTVKVHLLAQFLVGCDVEKVVSKSCQNERPLMDKGTLSSCASSLSGCVKTRKGRDTKRRRLSPCPKNRVVVRDKSTSPPAEGDAANPSSTTSTSDADESAAGFLSSTTRRQVSPRMDALLQKRVTGPFTSFNCLEETAEENDNAAAPLATKEGMLPWSRERRIFREPDTGIHTSVEPPSYFYSCPELLPNRYSVKSRFSSIGNYPNARGIPRSAKWCTSSSFNHNASDMRTRSSAPPVEKTLNHLVVHSERRNEYQSRDHNSYDVDTYNYKTYPHDSYYTQSAIVEYPPSFPMPHINDPYQNFNLWNNDFNYVSHDGSTVYTQENTPISNSFCEPSKYYSEYDDGWYNFSVSSSRHLPHSCWW